MPNRVWRLLHRPFYQFAHSGDARWKPAGVRCIHLTEDYKCALFGHPDRPKVCQEFQADPEICGHSREEALEIMNQVGKGQINEIGWFFLFSAFIAPPAKRPNEYHYNLLFLDVENLKTGVNIRQLDKSTKRRCHFIRKWHLL